MLQRWEEAQKGLLWAIRPGPPALQILLLGAQVISTPGWEFL